MVFPYGHISRSRIRATATHIIQTRRACAASCLLVFQTVALQIISAPPLSPGGVSARAGSEAPGAGGCIIDETLNPASPQSQSNYEKQYTMEGINTNTLRLGATGRNVI